MDAGDEPRIARRRTITEGELTTPHTRWETARQSVGPVVVSWTMNKGASRMDDRLVSAQEVAPR